MVSYTKVRTFNMQKGVRANILGTTRNAVALALPETTSAEIRRKPPGCTRVRSAQMLLPMAAGLVQEPVHSGIMDRSGVWTDTFQNLWDGVARIQPTI